jgi:hypothetical protein
MYGPDYLLVRYEDLFPKQSGDAGPPGLTPLLEWIGLPPSEKLVQLMRDKKLNASPNRGFPKWEQWDEPTRQAVLAMCGEQMRRYGYLATAEPAQVSPAAAPAATAPA